MIEQCEVQDIFTSACQTLVCPVNTVGTMGKGLAKSFKLKYPGLEVAYQHACRNYVFATKGLYVVGVGGDKQVLCFPTKHHWRNPSKLVWIDNGLRKLAEHWQDMGITSLALPMIGCGEGGLNWLDVYPLILEWLDPIELPVRIYLSDR
jgi:O-acetyl-ADP-ribose deacetylase (regulator of RNase III)